MFLINYNAFGFGSSASVAQSLTSSDIVAIMKGSGCNPPQAAQERSAYLISVTFALLVEVTVFRIVTRCILLQTTVSVAFARCQHCLERQGIIVLLSIAILLPIAANCPYSITINCTPFLTIINHGRGIEFTPDDSFFSLPFCKRLELVMRCGNVTSEIR